MDPTLAALILAVVVVGSVSVVALAAIRADKDDIAKRALAIIGKVSKKK